MRERMRMAVNWGRTDDELVDAKLLHGVRGGGLLVGLYEQRFISRHLSLEAAYMLTIVSGVCLAGPAFGRCDR